MESAVAANFPFVEIFDVTDLADSRGVSFVFPRLKS
jgi:hypothetical protein